MIGTYHTLLQLPITNLPPFRHPANCQQVPTSQPQIPRWLLRWRKLQLLACPHDRTVVLKLADAVRTRGQGLQRARCKVEAWQAAVARSDEAEQKVRLVVRVEEGGCADGWEERGVGLWFTGGSCYKEEVRRNLGVRGVREGGSKRCCGQEGRGD